MKLNDFNDVSAILGEELKLLTYLKKLKNRLYTSYYMLKRCKQRRLGDRVGMKPLSERDENIMFISCGVAFINISRNEATL